MDGGGVKFVFSVGTECVRIITSGHFLLSREMARATFGNVTPIFLSLP